MEDWTQFGAAAPAAALTSHKFKHHSHRIVVQEPFDQFVGFQFSLQKFIFKNFQNQFRFEAQLGKAKAGFGFPKIFSESIDANSQKFASLQPVRRTVLPCPSGIAILDVESTSCSLPVQRTSTTPPKAFFRTAANFLSWSRL